jgi:hypothetical protein
MDQQFQADEKVDGVAQLFMLFTSEIRVLLCLNEIVLKLGSWTSSLDAGPISGSGCLKIVDYKHCHAANPFKLMLTLQPCQWYTSKS